MRDLLIIKEKIKKFAGKNDIYIMPLLKFLLTFIALGRINGQIGYMTRLAGKPITLIIALAGSFLPMNLTLVILSLIVCAHVYALSWECAILVLALFLVLFLMYFRFSSKDSIAAVLVPLGFVFKIPYVVPVSMGLVGTVTSMVSVSCGVVIYQVLHYINLNADTIREFASEESKISVFKDMIDGLINNKAMFVYVAAFAATVLVVYFIRRMAIAYSWWIAIAAGSFVSLFVVLLGNGALKAGISFGSVILGILFSVIINIILQYFCFDLDYNRTEKVQFEDDEYYYYVKAVPKNTINLPEKEKKAPVKKQEEPVRRPASAPVKERPDGNTRVMSPVRETVRRTATDSAMKKSMGNTPVRRSTTQKPGGEDIK